MKKAIILFLVLIVVVGCSSGNHIEENETSKTYKFGATYMTLNNPFFVAVNNGIKDVVEANGDILITLDPALDPNKQIDQIHDLILQEVDAIFVNPTDWKAIRPGLEEAIEAGIPVINVDTPVFDTDLVASIVASDNYNAGVLCAKDMMSKLDAANIVIIEQPTAKSAIDRIQGFLDTIANDDQYVVIARESSEGQLEQAMPIMEKIMGQGIEINVIMALNDPTAMGAVAGLQNIESDSDILIYGVDGAPEAKQMIKDGKITATAAQSPTTIGTTAASVAYEILNGEQVDKEKFVDVIFIDINNIDEYGVIDWQ